MQKLTSAIRERLLDVTDLAIDFFTLGEYGLEAVPEAACPPPRCSGIRGAEIDSPQHLAADLHRPLEHARI
jgi:hypothetical protein